MRIDELDLTAFGPFTGRRLDFSRGSEGVHVVFGPNEAGKSSALRAIRDALFGIPTRSTDNFLHPYDALRIGFSLRAADGTRCAAVRLKRTKHPLLDPRTGSPLDDTTLAKVLTGVDREAFDRMFGLDSETLRAGGQEIARMQGNVGNALFAAAGGLVRLREIREALDGEASEIFKPRGQNQALNAAINRFGALKASLRDDRRSSREYKDKTDELEKVQREARDAAARLRDRRAEASLVDRIMKSRRLIEALDANGAAIGRLAGVRLLREGFGEDLRRATAAALTADALCKGARADLERIDGELAKLPRPAIASKLWPVARALPDALGAFRKASSDLPGIRRKAQADRAALEPRLERLRPGLALEGYAALFISPVDRQRITATGARLTTARASAATTRSELKKAERQRADADTALESTPDPIETRALEAAMTAAGRRGQVEEDHEEHARRNAAEAEAIRLLLLRAGRWDGPLERLRELSLPTRVTIDAHEATLTECQTELRRAREARATVAAEHARLSDERDALLAVEGALPTEGDVATARAARDGLWQAIRECWLGGGKTVEGAETHGVDPADLRAVGTAHDDLVAAADGVVDRVRREHTRVDKRARLESDIRARAAALETAARGIAAAEDALGRAERAWREVWTPHGVEAGTPREMREWLADIATIRTRGDALGEAETMRQRQADFIAEQRRSLRKALEAAGVELPEPLDTLAALLERGQEVVREQATRRERRASLETARTKAAERVDESTKQLESRSEELSLVEEEWARVLADHGIPAGIDPTEADTWMTECMEIHGLAHQLLGPDGSVTRIRHIENDFATFIRQVTDVSRELGDPATETLVTTVGDVAAGVLDRVERSRVAAAAIADAEARRAAAVEELDAKRTAWEASRSSLTALEQEAGAEAGADLAVACERSNERRRLEREGTNLEADLEQLADGVPTREWIATVRERQGEDLAGLLAESRVAIETLEEVKTAADRAVGQLTSELASVGAGTAAVDGNADMQARLGEIETYTREYARLWLSSKVLRRAVDAYRERNQGEVLKVASGYFAKLTQGAFAGLTIDYADDAPVIAGQRDDRSPAVRVEAMSEGTTDQLYLALRLAYIDLRARHHEPMPLILDDVLGTYDDDRAAATLAAFADVARKTQVILFTHHKHLLPIAEASVPAGALFVQDLSA